jgi:hypothetical protein
MTYQQPKKIRPILPGHESKADLKLSGVGPLKIIEWFWF